jgi:hypothetical protein
MQVRELQGQRDQEQEGDAPAEGTNPSRENLVLELIGLVVHSFEDNASKAPDSFGSPPVASGHVRRPRDERSVRVPDGVEPAEASWSEPSAEKDAAPASAGAA